MIHGTIVSFSKESYNVEMREASFYARINAYYLTNVSNSIAYDAKFTRSSSLPFSCLLPHQELKLLEAERILAYKITDNGIQQKPFDGFILYKATAILIAIYYVPRKTEFYEIPIRVFIAEREASQRKSLTKERAREIGKRVYL